MDKITSKNGMRPEFSGIYFTRDKMVATDSFRLIEVKKETGLVGQPRVIKAKGFKGNGVVVVEENDLIRDGNKLIEGEAVGSEYVEYEKIFPDAEPLQFVWVNPKLLGELLLEVAAHTEKVRIEYHDALRPLLITGENVRAMMAPLNI